MLSPPQGPVLLSEELGFFEVLGQMQQLPPQKEVSWPNGVLVYHLPEKKPLEKLGSLLEGSRIKPVFRAL